MGRIVTAIHMSLDGDVGNMHEWHGPYGGAEFDAAAIEQLDGVDGLIMGRKTYDGFSQYWPNETSALARQLNSLDKYTVSTTLQDPTWARTQVISTVDEIRGLREKCTLLQYGFGDVTRLLLANGLLDELRIYLDPVLSGHAEPQDLLYRDLPERYAFRVKSVDVHSTGLVVLRYESDK